MTLGAIVFGFGAHTATHQRWKTLYLLNFFIVAIAAGLYLSMALGQGEGLFVDRQTYWVRYVTWFLSTPLLLLVLSHLGRTSLPTVGSLIGANAYMIATGFAATISRRPVNYIWYIVSCGAFIAALYLLLQPYRREALQHYPGVGRKVFPKLLTAHVVLWTLYPIVWILANTGLGIIDRGFESMGYTLLDIASKVGFGFLALNSFRQLEPITARRQEPVAYSRRA